MVVAAVLVGALFYHREFAILRIVSHPVVERRVLDCYSDNRMRGHVGHPFAPEKNRAAVAQRAFVLFSRPYSHRRDFFLVEDWPHRHNPSRKRAACGVSVAAGAKRQYRSAEHSLSNSSRGRRVMASPKMFDLSGKVAVVTGGNGGIGRGIALGLAEAGAAVAILARNEEKNRAVVDELANAGVPAIAIKLDVTRRDDLRPAMEEVERKLGPVSVLVNNAGIAIMGSVLNFRAEDWDRVIETNLNSCFFLSQIAAQSMVARKQGKIINIASEYSLFGAQSIIPYGAAKGALVQVTKTMAIELAPHNIQVNAILPGWIETDMTVVAQSGPWFKEIIMRTPAGRFGKPEDTAGAAVFLASHASDFVTGSIVYVDGGYAIR